MEVRFQKSPDVEIASNTFKNCPVILQFEETPLIEVGKFAKAGFTLRYPILDSQGKEIAKVVGSRIFLTAYGKNAKIRLRHEQRLVVCEVEGKPIIELRKTGAAALKGAAEIYAPEGILVKAYDTEVSSLLNSRGTSLNLFGRKMQNVGIDGFPIAILLFREDGEVKVGLGAKGYPF